MPLYRYAAQCLALSEEVKSFLTGEEYEDVYDLLKAFAYNEWLRWRRERADALRSLASASPAKQQAKLQKMPTDERLLTVFALSQFYAEAGELLLAASALRPGVSYRAMAVEAWDQSQKVAELEHSFWPWDGTPTFRDFE